MILKGLDQIADYCGLSTPSLKKEIRAGRLKATKKYRKWRATTDECHAWALRGAWEKAEDETGNDRMA